jgi:hypothetical protein
MRSLNTLSLIGASLLHVTRGHMTQEIPSATIPTVRNRLSDILPWNVPWNVPAGINKY